MTALAFRVGAKVMALEAEEVAAVARRPALTRVPGAPPALAGICALQGRMTPVIELSRALSLSEGAGALLLALRGAEPVALAVDQVLGFSDDSSVERLDLRSVLAQALQPGEATAPLQVRPAPARKRGDLQALGFLAFSLGRQRFAFPLADVRAVIPAPAELLPVPGADPVVLGVAANGEGVLPVVELAALLGLPAAGQGKLIVVEIGGAPVGLRVERIFGALRLASHAVSPAPAALNRGAGEARVTEIARDASGLTAVLAANRLFDDATTQRLEALAQAAPQCAQPARTVAEAAILVFRLGNERYGLPVEVIEAVGKPPAKLAVPPNAPPFLAGVTSHRGETYPLVDLRLRFAATGAAKARAVIFIRSGEAAAGLLASAVEGLARMPREKLERAPAVVGDAGALFARAFATEAEGRPLLVADPASLLGQARRDLVAWTASRAGWRV